MYRYYKTLNPNYDFELFPNFKFGLSLESNTRFKFSDCYYIFKRGNNGHQSETLSVSFYSITNDDEAAENKINSSLLSFTFFTTIPFKLDLPMYRENTDEIPTVEANTDKIKKIVLIDTKINQLNNKKGLYKNVISTYNTGLKFLLIGNLGEESLLNFFKVIERIAVDDWECNNERIPVLTEFKQHPIDLKPVIKNYLYKKYEMTYSATKLNNITNYISALIDQAINKDIYSKIAYSARLHGISINFDELSIIVKLRNKIAHGNPADMSKNEEYCQQCFLLCQDFISKKFFDKLYKDIEFSSTIDII